MVSIPSSKTKHHLTGMDWVVHALDYMNKKASGVGGTFQIVLELSGAPKEDEVRNRLGSFVSRFHVLAGRTRRDYNLAPYWKMPSVMDKNAVALDVARVSKEEDVARLLERGVNTPFSSDREHLGFQLIYSDGKSYAAARFDHRLFDARGAEAFLVVLEEGWNREQSCDWEATLRQPAHLNRWRKKFEAGRVVNRAFLRLAENAPPRVIRLDREANSRAFRFRAISFSEEQNRKMMESAGREAGYLMVMPYTLALTVSILHEIYARRGVDSGDYVIPVTIDARPPGTLMEKMFFNHVSFLLFRIKGCDVDSFPVLLNSIKQQMYEQIKTGLSQHIWEASLLLRILPLPILSQLMRVYLKGEIGSFCFSFLGETRQALTRFMGEKVERSYHMTRVPIPPGVGVFFQQSQGRLNAYVSYLSGLLLEDEVDGIVAALKSRIGS